MKIKNLSLLEYDLKVLFLLSSGRNQAFKKNKPAHRATIKPGSVRWLCNLTCRKTNTQRQKPKPKTKKQAVQKFTGIYLFLPLQASHQVLDFLFFFNPYQNQSFPKLTDASCFLFLSYRFCYAKHISVTCVKKCACLCWLNDMSLYHLSMSNIYSIHQQKKELSSYWNGKLFDLSLIWLFSYEKYRLRIGMWV